MLTSEQPLIGGEGVPGLAVCMVSGLFGSDGVALLCALVRMCLRVLRGPCRVSAAAGADSIAAACSGRLVSGCHLHSLSSSLVLVNRSSLCTAGGKCPG